tara:strand:+ start:122 stop:667 length:546 start_codon:yes stop_codon:yes gene_type:complete
MNPPNWVVNKLEEIEPSTRLGWIGEDRISPDDEPNKGSFALLQLFRKRATKKLICDRWKNRGPVFGSRYDPLTHDPVWIINISKEDVFSGKAISLLRRWVTPIQERLDEVNVQAGRNYESTIQDMAHELGTELYKNAQASSDSCRYVANKHITKKEKDIISGEGKSSVSDVFRTKAAPLAV